jgi:Phospholipase_D-nuclease N-terminal
VGVGSGLFGLIILGLDVWAVIKILGSGVTTGKKMLWIILIVILPIIGLVIWAIAGPSSATNDPNYRQ